MRLKQLVQLSLQDGTTLRVFDTGDFESLHAFPAILAHLATLREDLKEKIRLHTEELDNVMLAYKLIEEREISDEC